MSTKTYPGLNELSSYIAKNQDPTLEEFVCVHKHDIAAWSKAYEDWTALASTWTIRYKRKMEVLRPDAKINVTCPPLLWQEVFSLIITYKKHSIASLDATSAMAEGSSAAIKAVAIRSHRMQEQLDKVKKRSDISDEAFYESAKRAHEGSSELPKASKQIRLGTLPPRYTSDIVQAPEEEAEPTRTEQTVSGALHYSQLSSSCSCSTITTIQEPSMSEWDIDSDEGFWGAWLQLLQTDIPHDLSLEKPHTIQCGFSIRCDPSVPRDLYNHLGLGPVTTRICQESRLYLEQYLADASTKDLDLMLIAATRVSRIQSRITRPFFRKILTHYPQSVYAKIQTLRASETGFNHRAIWPLFEAISDTLSGTEFLPGEIRLAAVADNGAADDKTPGFNADGLLRLNDSFDVLLLETSGAYGNGDRSRQGFDHVKGAFGVRMMLRAIFHMYYYGSIDSARQLALYFVHVRGTKLNIWSFSMPTDNILVMERIASVTVPVDVADRSTVLELLNTLWALRMLLRRTMQVILDLRNQHNSVFERYLLGDPPAPDQTDLRVCIQQVIEKPKKQAGAATLLPRNSPGIGPIESEYLIIENIE